MLIQTNSIWLKLIHSHLTWWWQPSWILPSWIWPSWIQLSSLVSSHHFLSFILTHSATCQDWFPPFAQKNFTHSFWLNLMMAAILNSAMLDSDTAILDSDTLLSSLRFTQKHSHSTLMLWLKLIQSDSNSFILTQLQDGQPSRILPCWIQPFCTKKLHSFILTQLDDGSHLEFGHGGFRHCHLGIRHLVIFSLIHSKHSHSTLMKNKTNSIWLKLIHSHLI